jgi:hypothetical protein
VKRLRQILAPLPGEPRWLMPALVAALVVAELIWLVDFGLLLYIAHKAGVGFF